MSWQDVAIAVIAAFQVIALAWIAAWQQRAAQLVRRLNGTVEGAIREAAWNPRIERRQGPPPDTIAPTEPGGTTP